MNNIIASLKNITNNPFIKNIAIVFTESTITKCLNFVIILLLIKSFSHQDYGIFSIVYVTVSVGCALIDFGMDNTIIRFSSRSKEHIASLYGIYFSFKVVLVTIISLLLTIFGESVLHLIKKDAISPYLMFIIVGIIAESILVINDTFYQAKEKFLTRAAINSARYTLTLVLLSIAASKSSMDIWLVLAIYYSIPMTIALIFSKRYILFFVSLIKNGIDRKLLKELFQYQKWMIILSILNNFLQRLDFFIVSAMLALTEVAKYNTAFQLATVALLLPQALGKVLLPKLSSYDTEKLSLFIKKSLTPIIILSVIMLSLIPFSNTFISFLFDNKYNDSAELIKIFLIQFIFIFISIPFEQSLYSLGKNNIVSSGAFIQIIIVSVFCPVLLKFTGITGAALAVTISKIIYFIYLYMNTKKQISCKRLGAVVNEF